MSKFLNSPQLPPGTKPLPTQVAGHKYGDGKIGMYINTLMSPNSYSTLFMYISELFTLKSL